MNTDSPESITEILSQLGFSRAEANCLLSIGKSKTADTKTISQETTNTYNMTKIMLQNLEKRGLVNLTTSEDQDTYEFAGTAVLHQYLETERTQQNALYDAAQDQLKSL